MRVIDVNPTSMTTLRDSLAVAAQKVVEMDEAHVVLRPHPTDVGVLETDDEAVARRFGFAIDVG
jgi:hypothetical protein